LAVSYAERFPMIRGGQEAWRYTLLSGLIPAIPLLLIRPFLPESPLWLEKRSKNKVERPALRELFRPALRKTTLVATLLFACSYALPFGAIQQTVRMIPGLAEVGKLAPRQIEQAASGVQLFQELGGLTGRILFALLVVRIASQRRRLRFFVALLLRGNSKPGIRPCWDFSRHNAVQRTAQFLGKLSPQNVSDAFTRYGREFCGERRGQVIGVSAALITTTLSNVMPGGGSPARLAYSAGAVSVFFLLAGLVGSLSLQEPEGDQLPD
jgi:hypothetical protein